jgi:hypothetical protein
VLVAVTPSTRPPTREVVSEGHRLGWPPLVGPNSVSTSATAKSRTVASTQLIVPVGDANSRLPGHVCYPARPRQADQPE